MNHDTSPKRRPVRLQPSGEHLEVRSLMTGGAGSIFALVPGTVAAAGEVVSHKFTLAPDQFTAPRKSLTLGIDIAAANGSSVKPKVVGVVAAKGERIAVTYPRGGVLPAKAKGTNPDVANGAVLAKLNLGGGTAGQGPSYTTRVGSDGKTTGTFLLGYYLPGDANGDGTVNNTDLAAINKSIGSIVGDQNYVFDADSNRDGRVGLNDLTIAKQNKGVTTKMQPLVTANLDPISDSGTSDRVTVYREVIFNGVGTPGATITYSNTNHPETVLTTKVGADGSYQLVAPLQPGSNTFHVSSTDPFGQTIAGNIAPVTYEPPAVPVDSPKPAAPQPAGTVGESADDSQDDVTPAQKAAAKREQQRQDQAERLRQMLARRQK